MNGEHHPSNPPSRLRRQVLEIIRGTHRWRRRAALALAAAVVAAIAAGATYLVHDQRVRPEQARIAGPAPPLALITAKGEATRR
jgi:hypothetical protein